MLEIIAGVEVPETAAVAEATRLVQETISPLLYQHSRRVSFGQIHAHRLVVKPDPGIPGRMGPDGLAADQVCKILAVHPRGDFKTEFLQTYFDRFKKRPETTNGTVDSDVVDHLIPGYRRTTVDRMLGAPWPG